MYLAIYPSTYLSIYLSLCLSVYLSIYLSICHFENQAILGDFLIFRSWQHQKRSNCARLLHFLTEQHPKRSNSARFLQFLNLTRSKTKAILRDILQKSKKLSAALTASYQCVLRFFHSTCLKYCACHEKLRTGHTKCCTCHAKSS